jgi:hypothetical protein
VTVTLEIENQIKISHMSSIASASAEIAVSTNADDLVDSSEAQQTLRPTPPRKARALGALRRMLIQGIVTS